MRVLMSLMTLLLLSSCATKREPGWDSGAQKQEDYDAETSQEQRENIKNEMPGQRPF